MKIEHEVLIKDNEITVDGKALFTRKDIEAAAFLQEAYRALQFNYPKFFKMDNLSKLAFLAAENLMKEAGLDKDSGNENMAVILYNSSSSLDVDIRFQDSMEIIPSPSLFVYTLPNVMMGEICIKYKIYGENYLFIIEKYDKDLMLAHAENMMKNSRCAKMMVGYADFCVPSAEAHFLLIGVM